MSDEGRELFNLVEHMIVTTDELETCTEHDRLGNEVYVELVRRVQLLKKMLDLCHDGVQHVDPDASLASETLKVWSRLFVEGKNINVANGVMGGNHHLNEFLWRIRKCDMCILITAFVQAELSLPALEDKLEKDKTILPTALQLIGLLPQVVRPVILRAESFQKLAGFLGNVRANKIMGISEYCHLFADHVSNLVQAATAKPMLETFFGSWNTAFEKWLANSRCDDFPELHDSVTHLAEAAETGSFSGCEWFMESLNTSSGPDSESKAATVAKRYQQIQQNAPTWLRVGATILESTAEIEALAADRKKVEAIMPQITEASKAQDVMKTNIAVMGLLSVLLQDPRPADFRKTYKTTSTWAKTQMEFDVKTGPAYLKQLAAEAENGGSSIIPQQSTTTNVAIEPASEASSSQKHSGENGDGGAAAKRPKYSAAVRLLKAWLKDSKAAKGVAGASAPAST